MRKRRQALVKSDIINSIAERSQMIKHPLGFLQLRLGEIEGKAVRLHLWPDFSERDTVTALDIHSHPWTMRSYILSGRITNTVYNVYTSDSGRGDLYEVLRESGHVSHIKLDQKVDWYGKASTFNAGEEYIVNVSEFHSSMLSEAGALTLIIAGLRSGPAARVIKTSAAPRLIKRTPIYLTCDEKLDALRKISALLSSYSL